jgi:hypothetical protein
MLHLSQDQSRRVEQEQVRLPLPPLIPVYLEPLPQMQLFQMTMLSLPPLVHHQPQSKEPQLQIHLVHPSRKAQARDCRPE